MNVVEAIRQKYPSMTKKQKALAEYMLAQPDSMSFMTLKALAAAAQVSEMTILHYCTTLGFANYNELKYAFRQYQSERAKIAVHGDGQYNAADLPADLLTDKRSLLAQICQEEFDLMKQFFAELDLEALFQAADMALDCRVILVCARGVSLQIADFLVNRLTTLGLPSLTVNTELNDAVQGPASAESLRAAGSRFAAGLLFHDQQALRIRPPPRRACADFYRFHPAIPGGGPQQPGSNGSLRLSAVPQLPGAYAAAGQPVFRRPGNGEKRPPRLPPADLPGIFPFLWRKFKINPPDN